MIENRVNGNGHRPSLGKISLLFYLYFLVYKVRELYLRLRVKMSKKIKHPWRICPLGEHWVQDHHRKIPVYDKNPSGIITVDGHCCKNPSQH